MPTLAVQLQATPQFIDPSHLVTTFGLIGLLTIVFAECGLLIGFFLPGDSLLFAAGLLIASGAVHVPLWQVLIGVPIAAGLGSLAGYWIGRTAGPKIFDRPDSRFFKQIYVTRAHEFFQERGSFAIIAGRFVPVVRTFITVVAGVAKMDFKKYAMFSISVSIIWGVGMPLLGYYLGKVDFVAGHIELIALAIAAVSVLPIVFEFLKHRRRQQV